MSVKSMGCKKSIQEVSVGPDLKFHGIFPTLVLLSSKSQAPYGFISALQNEPRILCNVGFLFSLFHEIHMKISCDVYLCFLPSAESNHSITPRKPERYMEYQAISITAYEKEENTSKLRRKGKLLPNRASSSSSRDELGLRAPSESQYQEEYEREAAYFRKEAAFESSLTFIERRLEERRRAAGPGGGKKSSSICIFRFPPSLVGINLNSYQPELVSIGPYHRGRDHLIEFEEHKWFFLEKFLSRTRISGKGLSYYVSDLMESEERTRNCYSDIVLMSSHEFLEMMLLDGCFVLELLCHLKHVGDVINEDDPIFTRPWLIPILIRDLLKLENQLPYFILHSLFESSGSHEDVKMDPLPILALKVFDLAFPRPFELLNRFEHWKGNHLLDLFHLSLLSSDQVINCGDLEEYRPSHQSIQCVTQLRLSGIKFKPRHADSFLDINFQSHVLEMPAITINDFTSTIFINCVALEQCQDKRSKYFTDYVSFMSCLINQPRDVAFLCLDGIVTRFSQDDKYVADLFNTLGKNVVFNIRDCYLSKQFREIESYYSSNRATIMRTYFSSPWSFISVFSAFVLLVLTMVQSVMSILSYKRQLR